MIGKAALSSFLIGMALAFTGLVFVPVGSFSGTRIELSNLAALALVFSLPVFGYPILRLPHAFRLICMALVWFSAVFVLDGAGIFLLPMTALAVLGGIALANLHQPSLSSWGIILVAALVVFTSILALAAATAGQNLVVGVADYLSSLNRSAFVFKVIRPTFNAFVPGQNVEYVASAINSLSGGFAILSLISFGCLGMVRGASIVAVVSVLFVFILFSSSSVLAVASAGLLLAIRWIRQSERKLGPIVLCLALLTLSPFLMGDLALYLAANIGNDDASRAARLGQYAAAVELIAERPWTGHGLVEVSGHTVHNWLLFAGVTGGIGLMGVVLAVYAVVLRDLVRACRLALGGGDPRWLAVAGLLGFFLIRISFGGAGGMPTTLAAMSLGFACLMTRAIAEVSPSTSPVRRNPARTSPRRRAGTVP